MSPDRHPDPRSAPVFELTRRVEFCAAHRLHNPAWSAERNREVFGVCNNSKGHGHNYVLDVTLRGPLDPDTGMVADLNRMAVLLHEQVYLELDHRHLDEDVAWLSGRVSTAENVVAAIWQRLEPHFAGQLFRLRLFESRLNFVEYHGP